VYILLVDDIPISEKVKNVFKKSGIYELYPPQEEAVTKGKILEGESLIASFPTAAGKTFVAEIGMLNVITKRLGKALYLAPLKALASEKVKDFRKWEEAGLAKVTQSSSDFDEADNWLERYDIIVSTNEKADSLLRHKPKWLHKVKLIVVDEMHIIDDDTRGPTLEVFIAKIKQILPDVQIIGLSATIPNAQELANWLNANLVLSNWRPVKLKEGIYFDKKIIFDDGTEKEISPDLPLPLNIIKDTLSEGGQVIVFLPTRARTVSQAVKASKMTFSFLTEDDKTSIRRYLAPRKSRLPIKKSQVTRKKVDPRLNICSSALTKTILGEKLCEVVQKGAAFHHAGLNSQQRSIVEYAFKKKIIKVIFATPTLAAGVNLPARIVIISHQRWTGTMYRDIKVSEVKQMGGRAGRPRLDAYGESILIATSEEEYYRLFRKYLMGKPEPISSKLNNPTALRSHLLAYIAQQEDYVHQSTILEFIENTFFGYQFKGAKSLLVNIKMVIKYLLENEFLESEGDSLIATELGKKVTQLYIDPKTAVIVRYALEESIDMPDPFALNGWSHLLAFTPNFRQPFIRMGKKKDQPSELDLIISFYLDHSSEMLIEPRTPRGDVVYLEEITFEEIKEFNEIEMYLKSLKVALIMSKWVNEESEKAITQEFKIGPGDLATYRDTYKWLFYSSQEIARILGYTDFVKPLGVIGWRIVQGVKEDILALTKLKGIGRVYGRRLFKAGFESLDDLLVYTEEEAIELRKKLIKIEGIGPNLSRSIIEQVSQIELE
jgi:helicase